MVLHPTLEEADFSNKGYRAPQYAKEMSWSFSHPASSTLQWTRPFLEETENNGKTMVKRYETTHPDIEYFGARAIKNLTAGRYKAEVQPEFSKGESPIEMSND